MQLGQALINLRVALLRLSGQRRPVARESVVHQLEQALLIRAQSFRPSTGELYAVGNDSRVYTLDAETGQVTPVGPEFTPKIASFFDIHFGMGFDPVTERIRLIARESGANWSLDPDDGTAVLEESVHFAEGDPNEGSQLRLAGLAYTPLNASAANAGSLHGAAARLAGPFCPDLDVGDLMWSVSTLLKAIVGSCDPGSGEFITIAPLEGIDAVLGCAEVNFDPEGNLFGTLLYQAQQGAEALNSLFGITPEASSLAASSSISVQLTHLGDVPVNSPIQAIAFDPNAEFRPPSQATSSSAPLSVAAAGDVLTPGGVSLEEACAGASR